MANIKIIGDRIMNLYYQDYAGGVEFFDIDDFTYYAGVSYAELLAAEYDKNRNQMRQDGEDDIVSFSHDWLVTAVVKKQTGADGDFAVLPEPVMSFPYDKRDCGIQNIFPVGTGGFKYELIRGSIDSDWMNEYLPLTCKIFWSLLENKIFFFSNQKSIPNEMKVVYVPAVSDLLNVPESRTKMVMDNTIKMMKEADKGFVVKTVNDQNLNKAMETEIDKNLTKQ